MEARGAVPEIGTPEFREFVQTPEWMELRHDQALEDDLEWEKEQQYRIPELADGTPVIDGVPCMQLGASAHCDSRLWSSDRRERLPIDHPYRMDYEEEVYGKPPQGIEVTAEDIDRMEKLHKVALLTTVIVR